MTAKKTEKDSSKIALVLGGAGFIGSYVCEQLIAQNIKTYALDDLSSGSESNLQTIKKEKNFKLVIANVNDGLEALDLPKFDYIFHIGGIESYLNGHDLTINTMLVNSVGTYKTLEIAKAFPNSKYLLVSSLDIYNGVLSSVNLKKYYGVSDRDNKKYTHHEAKRYAEALLTEYVNKFNLDGRIVRVADVYGPRMDLESGTDIAQMIKETVDQDTVTINGDGLKSIRPTHVTDVVSGILKAMISESTAGKIFNLVAEEEINLLNLAYTIQKNSTKAIKIQFNQKYTELQFPARVAELKQTEEQLDWKAKTPLNEGITQTLEYYFLSENNKNKNTTDEVKQVKTEYSNLSQSQVKNQIIIQDNLTKQVQNLTKVVPSYSSQITNEKKPQQNLKYINTAILALSFFIILLLFVFPLVSLTFTTPAAISKSLDSMLDFQSTVNHDTTIAQSLEARISIQQTLAQYENLEWYFSIIHQHDNLEIARANLNGMDNLNQALLLSSQNKELSSKLIEKLIIGKAEIQNQTIIENQKNEINIQIDSANLNLTGPNLQIPFNTQKQQLISIKSQTKDLLEQIRNLTLVNSNALKIFLPSETKKYILIFIDSRQSGFEGGVPFGFAAVNLNQRGIKDINFKEIAYSKSNTLDQAIGQGKDFLKNQKNSNIDGVFLLNTSSQKKIISNFDQINIKSFAQIINVSNYSQKIESASASIEIQYQAWKEIWNKLKESDKSNIEQIQKAITDSILSQNIKLASVSSQGVYGLPLCETDQILYNNFAQSARPVLLDPKTVYCINIAENSTSQSASDKIKRSISTEIEKDNARLTYKFANKDSAIFKATLQIMLPQEAKLTNVQDVYPLSFDKIKKIAVNKYISYQVDIVLNPQEVKNLTFEWSDSNLQNEQTSNIYIAKPFGINLESNTIQLKSKNNLSTQAGNRDAILKIPSKQ